MSTRAVAPIIGILRAAGGLAAYGWPAAFARHGQVPDAGTSTDSRYVTRLFGARDIVIGAATVAGPAQRSALWLGVVCDVMDTASGFTARREGKDAQWVRSAGSVTTLFALAGLLAGVRWAADGRPTKSALR